MRVWLQIPLAAALGAAGVVGVAHHVPAARPALNSIGVMGWLDRLGLAPATDAAAATVQQRPGGPGGRGPAAVSVLAVPPEPVPMVTEVAAIGTGVSRRAVSVRPEVAGRLAEVVVVSGQRVSAGDVLARIEAESEQIARARAELVLGDARAQYDRISRLRSSGSASEIQQAGAELTLRQAELALRQAEFELERRIIRAPIDGLAGIVELGPGDQIALADTLTRIDDRTQILIDFAVPERFVGLIHPGRPVAAAPLSRPEQEQVGRISAIDNRVDPATRSIRLQAAIANVDDQLRAGMAFSIRMRFDGESYPAVDPLAIQWSSDGAFVWVARDGVAMRMPVRIVQRGSRQVLVHADFAPGDLVVIEGVQALRPGGAVNVIAPMQPQGAVGGRPAGEGAEAAVPRQRG